MPLQQQLQPRRSYRPSGCYLFLLPSFTVIRRHFRRCNIAYIKYLSKNSVMDSSTIIRYHLHSCRQNVGTPSNLTPSVVVDKRKSRPKFWVGLINIVLNRAALITYENQATAFAFIFSITFLIPNQIEISVNTSTILPLSLKGAS